MSTDSQVLGVIVMTRHGDRRGFYQDPKTYTPSNTGVTPLGNQQSFQLGEYLRSRYLTRSSPHSIQNISPDLLEPDQVLIRADGGGEGNVIYNSAVSTMQGMWPAYSGYSETLANGTVVVGPLNGYQYVPIESVEPENDISLEGWTACNAFANATKQLYASPSFKAKGQEYSEFLQALSPYLGGRPADFENMWNVFDYVSVQSIHNATFASELPPTFVEQARHLANWHEYHVFSSPDRKSISTIAVRTFVPPLMDYIHRILNSSDPLKFAYTESSYKPFISLFNVTGVAQMNDTLAGVVDFSGSIAFEIHASPTNGPFVRFNFKNGTADSSYNTYGIMGSSSGDIPVQFFVDYLAPLGVGTLPEWCKMCGNTNSRGCQFLQENVNLGTDGLKWGGSVSPIGAGFLGAGLTAIVVGILVTVGIVLGPLRLGRMKSLKRTSSAASSGGSALVVCAYKRRSLTLAIDSLSFNRIILKRCKSEEG
ncbi:phosphoglycerate mutase-like protein [Thelephora ganbajun]|uniref:Phosphoglycerate mutase-like protein n=1 Tax=Thelephora ganbajun TaxID=370292 RepID=A0ACB6Z9N0_THEGA|nr:phosphoglycerate mutase-like protein [Thelephora ganbajun]